MTEKEYQKEYHQKWYKENKKERIKQIRKRRLDIRKWLNEYKSNLKCEICTEHDPICLDFHHKDPSKKDLEIGQAVKNGWSKEKILEEINKCNVLCSNCHRKVHFNSSLL